MAPAAISGPAWMPWNIVPNALPWQRRVLGRGALLPLVMLVTTVYWGIRPWTVLVIAAAGAVAVFAPPVAGGLAAIALIGFASCAFALFLRDSTNPPGSGTLRQYPLHSVVFGPGFPHAVNLTAGLVMLACGMWLVPRTIGGHSALARRNRELIGRVRRLSLARVAAVDTAAAELRRVERDLHDGAQARLIALGISLRAAERLIRTDPDAAVALVAEAGTTRPGRWPSSAHWSAASIRRCWRNAAWAAALRALALDSPLPAATDIDLPGGARPGPGGRVLRGGRGAGQRGQARQRAPRAHPGGALGGRAAHRGDRRRRGRRGPGSRHRVARDRDAAGYIRRRAGGRQPTGRPDHRRHRGAVRVVIAEDLFLLREGLASLLKEHGFEIAEAVGDGPSLLRALLEHRPDVAIVDVRLPPAYTDEGLRAALTPGGRYPGCRSSSCPPTSSSSMPANCWPTGRAASATCSRTGCSPTSSSPTRCAR